MSSRLTGDAKKGDSAKGQGNNGLGKGSFFSSNVGTFKRRFGGRGGSSEIRRKSLGRGLTILEA